MDYKNIESFNPQECISGKMTRINRITANIFRKHLKPFGVTNSQLTLLFVLSKKNNLNQKQLSDIAVLEKSSLNRNLNRLIEAGLISKDKFPIIRITEKGKILVDEIIPVWRSAMDEIEDLLEEDGQEALSILISKLHKNK